MAKPEDQSKSDDLEIVLIGTLYSGPLEKKYWSSSRRKDKYPYPIGYHVIRTHNGVTYNMEIQEGTKGPTFQITSSDGHSSSGVTPDMACQNFLKKSGVRPKMWHAKRLTSKDDGGEFFGFTNMMVQRLLRELTTKEHDTPSPQLVKCADPVPQLSNSQVTMKRSRKHIHPETDGMTCTKACLPYQASSVNLSNSKGRNQMSDAKKPIISPFSREVYGKCNVAGLPQDPEGLPGTEDLDRSGSLQVQKPDSLIANKLCFEESREILVDSQINTNCHLFAPDTFDTQQDNLSSPNSVSVKEPREAIGESSGAPTLRSEEPSTRQLQEEEVRLLNSYDSPGIDSEYEDIRTSMMAVLLPKAVPFLTYSSRKRRKKVVAQESSLRQLKPDNYQTLSLDVVSDIRHHENNNLDKTNVDNTVRPSGVDALMMEDCAASDSVEPDQCQAHALIEVQECHDAKKAVESNYGKIIPALDRKEMHFSGNAIKVLDSCQGQTCWGRQGDIHISSAIHVSSTSAVEEFFSSDPIKNGQLEADQPNPPLQTSNVITTVEVISGAERFIPDETEWFSQSGFVNELVLLENEKNGVCEISYCERSQNSLIKMPQDYKASVLDHDLVNPPLQTSNVVTTVEVNSGSERFVPDRLELLSHYGLVNEPELLEHEKNGVCEISSCEGPKKIQMKMPQDDKASVLDHDLVNPPLQTSNVITTVEVNSGAERFNPDRSELLSYSGFVSEPELLKSEKNGLCELSSCDGPQSYLMKTPQDKKASVLDHDLANPPLQKFNVITAVEVNSGAEKFFPHRLELLAHSGFVNELELLENEKNVVCEISSIGGPQNFLMKMPQDNNASALDHDLGGNSCGQRDKVEPRYNCLDFNNRSRSMEYQPRKREYGAASECIEGLVGTTKAPGKEQLSDSRVPYCLAMTSCRNNYGGPLSESIICRKMGDESSVATGRCEGTSSCAHDGENVLKHYESSQRRTEHNIFDGMAHETRICNELEGPVKLIGCYYHGIRISSVTLMRTFDYIYVCALCGLREEKSRNLLIYKLPVKPPSLGFPSFIGHTTVMLPCLRDTHGKEISTEIRGLQFTPDGRGLVLLNAIELPYCREGKLHCPCSTCTAHSSQHNGVKIVQVNHGYVSMLVKLSTAYPVHCILVCELDHLVALDENGMLYFWVMNPTWSAPKVDYVISSYDSLGSRVVDLKKVPKCASLVVGHNGLGDFSLWDITKRLVISRFGASATSILNFLPISWFTWQNEDTSDCKIDECVQNKIMEATKLCFSEYKTAFSLIGENIAVWLLVCTASAFNAEPGFQSSSCPKNPCRCWRLSLLMEEKVLLGPTFTRADAINVSVGHGIIGTDKGLVYMWELLTGTTVGILDDFEGTAVSHIVTDDSTSSSIAIADENGKLRIYLSS